MSDERPTMVCDWCGATYTEGDNLDGWVIAWEEGCPNQDCNHGTLRYEDDDLQEAAEERAVAEYEANHE